jgi:hypothetical protein
MLQMIRTQTGSSSEAATAMANVFQKMESEETANKFKKFGVDLRKEMAKARKEGKNLIDFFIELSNKTVKGDLSKLPQLFSDAQMQQGMRALMMLVNETGSLRRVLGNVDGSTLKDLKRVTDDAQASIDRLSNSWNAFVNSMAKAADKAGIPTALEGTAKVIGGIADLIDAKMQGKSDKEAFSQAMGNVGMTPDDAGKYYDRKFSGPVRSYNAKVKADQMSHLIDNVNRASEILSDHIQSTQDLKDKYDGIRNNPNATPMQIAAAKQMAASYANLQAMTAKLVDDLKAAVDTANTAALETVAQFGRVKGGGPSGLPADEGWTHPANVGGPKSGATQHRPGRPFRDQPAQEVMIAPTPDEARALQTAQEIRNKVQQFMNANPVTIPVRPGSVGNIGAELGRQVQSELNGSYTDNNGR